MRSGRMEEIMDASSADGRVSGWLAKFGKALEQNDVEAAAKMFAPESYWRDLVAFTWNIKTAEGRDAIAKMLKATLKVAKAKHWKLEGKASEADGVTEGWFTFETP